MQTQVKMDNELMHYGILGQKWGIRRYQNKDGSLTAAGRKRANKLASEYEKTTGKKISEHGKSSSSSGDKKKISEMSDDEIRAKINRLRLENDLKSLSPKHISLGQRLVDTMKDKGVKIVGDLVDNKIRDALGISKKDDDASKVLQKLANDYENRQKIDKGQQYFKEGKYANQNNQTKSEAKSEDKTEAKSKAKTETKTEDKTESKSKAQTETYSGTVEGKGTSKRTEKNKYDTSDAVDGEFRDLGKESTDSSTVNTYAQIGESYLNRLLLEDKKNK